jgi:hypothetical protein
MKFIYVICFVSMLFSCSKSEDKSNEYSDFTSRVFKGETYWKTKSAQGVYHLKDSMQYVIAYGENNERLSISFKKDYNKTGRQNAYVASLIESNCEVCASIKNSYSIDSTKINSLEFMSFDNSRTPNRIGIRFSINFKKDSLYTDYKSSEVLYNGIIEVPFENETGL